MRMNRSIYLIIKLYKKVEQYHLLSRTFAAATELVSSQFLKYIYDI